MITKIRRFSFWCGLFGLLVSSASFSFGAAASPGAGEGWVTGWMTALQLTEPANMPPKPGLSGNTLRQDVVVTLGGGAARFTFSNAFGHTPLAIDAAAVARTPKPGADIQAGTSVPLLFAGKPGIVLEPGASMVSDPVDLKVAAGEWLAISIHMTSAPSAVTGHPGSRTTSFLALGNEVGATELPVAATAEHWYFLSRIDVLTPLPAAACVVLGDSITDGRGSTTNHNNRWPDELARRLRENPATAHIAVLNAGIGGNRLLRDGLGPNALARFDRDVLAPSGVKWLIVLEGINDLGTRMGAEQHGWPYASADDIIMAYRQIITRAHAHHIRVYGATIMPYEDCFYFTKDGDAARQKVNTWIRTSGWFDGVIDFDAVMRDPKNPDHLSPAYDSGDHLHPSPIGHKAMGDAVNLALFSR